MGYDDTALLKKPGILANSETYASDKAAIATSMKKKPQNAKKKAPKKRPSVRY